MEVAVKEKFWGIGISVQPIDVSPKGVVYDLSASITNKPWSNLAAINYNR
jgi:hypothetical protein